MATPPDDILINAVMQAESRGKRFDKAGKLLTSVKGAEGEMQVMPTTQSKPGFGITPARDSSAEEKARVGRDYLKAMISKYGDTTTALAAYNWGPGKVNKWLEKGGDFNKLPKETQNYIQTIQASLPKGSQLASAPPAKVKPSAKAPINKATSAAPAKPPVSITKEMVADLGPNYQAALAAMALGDTREDDDDEESIAERYAAKQEQLAEEAASVPPPRIAGMEMTYQSPFPEEQIAQAPEGLAHGGVPRRGNSARDALRMMKEAQQQQQPVQRAEGSPEEGEKDLSEDPIGDFLNKYELEQLRKKIAENDAAITDLEPVPTEVETGSDPMLLDISPARKRAIEANPELFEYGTAQLKDEEYARPMLRNDPDTFNENWLEYKLRPRGQSDFSNKYPPGMELSMPYPRTPVKPKRWEAWDQYYAKGGEAVNEYAPDIPQEREPSFGTRAGGWLSDKIVEGGMKLYSATSDSEKLPASHRIFLDTFNKDQRGPITAKDFSAKELAELQNIIALNEKAKNGKGVGSIAYADYNTLPDTEKRTVEGDIIKGKGSARSSLSNSLGQFNYRLNPKTQQYEIIDEYDFNPMQAKVAGKMRDVPPALYGDYITHSLSPEKGLRDLARMYGGRHMPPGKGRKVELSVPVKRAGGSPETGEYYQDPMGMDTGPVTADTVKAMTLPQGLSAKEAMGALKGIAKEGVSNAESLGRGSAASFPGLAGDVESVFRDEKKRKFKTTEEVLKTEMPKRMTTPTKEAAGFEEVGTYIDPTTGLPFAKGAAKAALAGLKSSGPQVEKALMKMAPGAEPSYIIPREASAGVTLKNVDSLVNDYKTGVDNILPPYAPNRGPLLSMLDKKASDYFYNVYGSKNDPIRQAILDGKLPAYLLKDIKEYAKDPTVLNAARKGDKKALDKFDLIYDQLTGLTKAGERGGKPVYDLYGSTASRLPFFSRNVLIESLSTIPFNRLDKMTFPEAVIEGTNNYVKKIYGTEKKNLTFMPETSLK